MLSGDPFLPPPDRDGGKIAVAMSGGVDSSVAAALLARAGYQVIGYTVDIWPEQGLDPTERNCCSPEAAATAKEVCDLIGAEHVGVDQRALFAEQVVEKFADSYWQGITPNPCIDCNQHIKFSTAFEQLQALGATRLATGHYARIAQDRNTRRFQLLEAADPAKDQSYVLYVLDQVKLGRLLFPLGSMAKGQTRALAHQLGLPNADRRDSVDICFVAGNYRDFISEQHGGLGSPGPILLADGSRIGEHRGLAGYTIGQRRGLGVSHRDPLFVAQILPDQNAIVLGRREDLFRHSFRVEQFNPVSVARLRAAQTATVRVRSSARRLPCRIRPVGGSAVEVAMDEPVWGLAPGQAAVFYEGDLVLGGGRISVRTAAPVAEELACAV